MHIPSFPVIQPPVLALKSDPNCWLHFNALSLINPPEIDKFYVLADLNHSKTALPTFLYAGFFNLLELPLAQPLSIAVITVCLFFKIVHTVFATIHYSHIFFSWTIFHFFYKNFFSMVKVFKCRFNDISIAIEITW